jgi:hypothetical protein
MLLSVRNRGLTLALNIQRYHPQEKWPDLWAAIEDKDERQVAAQYLQDMALRLRVANEARGSIDRARSAAKSGA